MKGHFYFGTDCWHPKKSLGYRAQCLLPRHLKICYKPVVDPGALLRSHYVVPPLRSHLWSGSWSSGLSNWLPQEALKIGHWNQSLLVCAFYGLGQNRLISKVEAAILNLQGLVQCAGDPNSGPCSCIESTFTTKPSFQHLTHF